MDNTVASETLAIVIAARDEASAALGRIGAELDALNAKAKESVAVQSAAGSSLLGFGKAAEKVGRDMSTYVTLPIVGIGVASAAMAMKFQQSMTYIRTDAGDMTDNIGKMSKAVLDLARNSQFSPDELANGLYHLASLGLRGADAINSLNTAQKMAAVGGADLESTTSALGAAIVTGIKGVQDYNHAAGVLDATIGAGNMRMQDMVDALGTGVLPVFKNAGLSIVDFGAALATLTDNGMDAAMAATRLRMTISLMESPSRGARDALKSLGMSANQLGMDMQTKGLIPALQDLQQHLIATYGTTAEGRQKIAAAMTEIFGGGRSSGAVQTLVDQLGRMQNKFTQISDQSGEFAQKYADQQQTAAYKIKTAWSSIQADAIELGGAILPQLAAAFAHLANGITDVVNWFNRLDEPNKKLIIGFLEVLAVVGPVLLVIGKTIKIFSEMRTVIFDSLIPALTTLIGSFSSLWTIILGGSLAADAVNPIFAIITLIALLALAIYEIVVHWSEVKTWMKNFWEDNQKYILLFAAIVNASLIPFILLADVIIHNWEPVKQFFEHLWRDITKVTDIFVDGFMSRFDRLKAKVAPYWTAIAKDTKDAWNGIWHDVNVAVEGLEKDTEFAFSKLVGKSQPYWNQFKVEAKKEFEDVRHKVGDILDDMTNSIIASGGRIHKDLLPIYIDVKNKAIDIWDTLKFKTVSAFEDIKNGAINRAREMKPGLHSAFESALDDINILLKSFVKGDTLQIVEQSLKKHGDEIGKEFGGAVKTGIKNTLSGVGNVISEALDALNPATSAEKGKASVMTNSILKAMGLGGNQEGLKGAIKSALTTLLNFDISSLLDWKTSISSAGKSAKRMGEEILHGLKQGWGNLKKDGSDLIKEFESAFKDAKKDYIDFGKEMMKAYVKGLGDEVKSIINFFKNLPKTIYNDVHRSGQDTADNHQKGFKDTWTSVDKMKKLGDAILKGIGIAIAAVLAAIVLLAASLGIAIINGVIKGIGIALGALDRATAQIGQHVKSIAAAAGSWLYDTGVNIIDGLVRGMKSAVGRVSSFLKTVGSNVAGDIKGVLHTAHIPGFAQGVRNYIGGMAMVGENGPEMVYLPPGSNVYSNGDTSRMMGNSNTSTVTIGTVVLSSAGAVQEFFKKIDQDNILTGMGMTPNRGIR